MSDPISESDKENGYIRYVSNIDYTITLDKLEELKSSEFAGARIYYRELPTNRKEYQEYDHLDMFVKSDFMNSLIYCLLK